MNELAAVWLKIGATGFGCVLAAYVLLKHVIPHWKQKDAREQEFRHRQSERIQNREDGILKEISGLIRENVTQGEKVAERLDAVTELIREEAREKRRR